MALGHHKRDVTGKSLSRTHETRAYRLKYPGRRRPWDATYRQSEAGHIAHQEYNDSEKGRLNSADGNLKRKYGKGLDDKIAQHQTQNGLCGVCGNPLSTKMNECHWDHRHETGELREILHPRCNIAVGFMESELQQPVLEYLKRHRHD